MAAICVKTSGAPLPNDSSVAPATSGGSLSISDTSSTAGQKNLSAACTHTIEAVSLRSVPRRASPLQATH
jgi:hypothetical protein